MTMETIDALRGRRSVRSYEDRPVPPEAVRAIAEAGTFAPSGNGNQMTRIIAITDRALRDRLSQLNAAVRGMDDDPFYGAPAVLVVLADSSVSTYLQDGSLVMGNLMNAAYDQGLGSCWVHRAKEQFESDEGRALLEELGMPAGLVGIGNCIIGYADGSAVADERKEGRIAYWV